LRLTFDRVQQMQQPQQNALAGGDDDDDDDDRPNGADDEQQNDQASSTSVSRPRRKTVSVGSAAVLDCDVEYPLQTADSSQRYVQNIVTWRRQGVEAPVFIAFDGYPPRVDASYLGRVRAVGQAAIEISKVKTSDQGWYECTVLFIDQEDKSPSNGTWTYLAVNSTSNS